MLGMERGWPGILHILQQKALVLTTNTDWGCASPALGRKTAGCRHQRRIRAQGFWTPAGASMFQRAINPFGPAAQPVLALGKAITLTLRSLCCTHCPSAERL